MYPELNGKVAIISGAGGTLGAAVAKRLNAEGVRLALSDRREEALRPFTTDGSFPSTTLLETVDLTAPQEVENAVAKVVEKLSSVDILVNVAGAFTFSGPVHEMNPDDFDKMFAINVKTALLLSAAVAKRMVAADTQGRLINVGARAALTGVAGMSAYCASKSAVLRLTESMAAELLEHGITVNAVLPSTIDTPPNRKAMPDADFRKWVAPESLADVIAFLASDAARDISGAAIPVYGRA